MESAELPLRIEVVFSAAAGSVWRWQGRLAAGSVLRDALQVSGLLAAHPEVESERLALGVWGRAALRLQPLADRDRVEVYRPLLVDPKEARRLRYRSQRERPAPIKR